MFEGFTEKTPEFFWELAFNNEREWFAAHKEEFVRTVETPFKALAADTFARVRERWPEEDFCLHLSRIYRDARRLFGRGPYKDNLWFSVQLGNQREGRPMFWFEVGKECYSYGMGFWDATPAFAAAWREYIDSHTAAFEEMLKDLGPCKLWGQEYARPKGSHTPLIDPWYNRRQVAAGYEFGCGGALYTPALPDVLMEAYQRLMPLYRLLFDLCRGVEEQENRKMYGFSYT